MGEAVLQAWLIFKWFVFAALGSGLAVFIDKTEEKDNSWKRKLGWFFFGATMSIVFGSAFIEWQGIAAQAMQGAIYFGMGVWSMGIAIQVAEKLPSFINQIADKASLIIDKFAEKFLK